MEAEKRDSSPSRLRSSPHPDGGEGDSLPFLLKFLLHCQSTESREEVALTLASPPETVLDIKRALEAECGIPACTQKLKFESAVLRGTETITTLHVRSGDRLSVSYKARAECTAIKEAIEWMCTLSKLLEEETLPYTNSQAFGLITTAYQTCMMENLAFKRFSPWVSPVVEVNKLYFLQEGGLEALLKLFALVLQIPWSLSPPEFKYVEHVCMTVVSNLASSLELRKLIVSQGIILMCLQSLLRVRLDRGQPVVDDSGSRGAQYINNTILQDTMRSDVAMIANVCELPETHIQIASNTEALRQLICVSHSPSYEVLLSQLVATIFLCLAHSHEVHSYLAQPEVVSSILEACDVRKDQGIEEKDHILLEYFSQMFLAQLALCSPHLLPQDSLAPLATRMEWLLRSTTPRQLMEFEENRRFSWSVFLPYLRLAYAPNVPQTGLDSLLNKLQLLALELVLFWLQNTLGRPGHRETLTEEGLSEYIICLPWFVPEALRDSADALVSAFVGKAPISPPRLSTLARGKLAKMHFGLEKVIKAVSGHELL